LTPFLSETDAVHRLVLAYVLMGAGAVAIAALGVFISSFSSHALTATGATFGIVLVTGVLGALGRAPEEITFLAFFRTIRPYLLTTHFNVYDAPLLASIDWTRIHHSLLWLAGYTIVFIAGALIVMSRRDIRC
jgi:ABC-type transport system involved in multi-copper enzyme maturation permease subunit